MKIRQLEQSIINKIAAGEVVERPASVVKELMENSIDAHANTIDVTIENGGLDYICIADDGDGISKEDLPMTIEQHATSKVATLDDLFNINTFGFRGEALASISSVCDLVIQSKMYNMDAGNQLSVRDNSMDITDVSCTKGTKIEVHHLFKHVPARKAYLKTSKTEYNHILDTFIHFALVYTNIRFTLTHNGKSIYTLRPTQDPKERISHLLGSDIANVLLPVKGEAEGLRMRGFVSIPHTARSTRSNQYIFMNGRYIKSAMINRAVMQAYDSLLPPARYPAYIIMLQVDPALVDVNVHPRKLEVRFVQEQPVFRLVRNSIAQSLAKHNINKDMETVSSEPKIYTSTTSRYKPTYESYGAKQGSSFSSLSASSSQYVSRSAISQTSDLIQRPLLDSQETIQAHSSANNEVTSFIKNSDADVHMIGNWNLIGQLRNSYLLVEDTQKGLIIIDQHGADERVKYHRLKQIYANTELHSAQQLLIPITKDIALKEYNMIMDAKDELMKIGFEVESFGEKSIVIHSVPSIIKQKDPSPIIDEIISEIVENEQVASDSIDYILKTVSCKSAIKFGDELSIDEQIQMLKDLQNVDNVMACAHGRPIILEFSWEYINRRFERPN